MVLALNSRPLLQQLNAESKLTMLRNATWTLSNFCRGAARRSPSGLRDALLRRRLLHSNDEEENLTDACKDSVVPVRRHERQDPSRDRGGRVPLAW